MRTSTLKLPDAQIKIILLINGKVGLDISRFLINNKEQIRAVFLPNADDQNQEYIQKSKELFDQEIIYSADLFKNGKAKKIISKTDPQVLITCYWDFLLKEEIFQLPTYGCINLHPGYLPKNRGWYPNIWPIVDGTQAGVTLHLIDKGADTGPIIAQEKTTINPTDTAESLYEKQQKQLVGLFKKTWIELKKDGIEIIPQADDEATYHYKNDLYNDIEIDLEKLYKARDLINLFRSRSFKDKGLAYFVEDGEKINIKIELEKES